MKYLTAIFACLLFISCQSQKPEGITTLSPKEFAEKLKSTPEAQLLDVRTPGEYASDRLDNSTNIDWNGNDFEAQVATFDQSKPVFLYCRSGGRSAKAADKLKEMGFSQIYNMDGGMLRWNADGLGKSR